MSCELFHAPFDVGVGIGNSSRSLVFSVALAASLLASCGGTSGESGLPTSGSGEEGDSSENVASGDPNERLDNAGDEGSMSDDIASGEGHTRSDETGSNGEDDSSDVSDIASGDSVDSEDGESGSGDDSGGATGTGSGGDADGGDDSSSGSGSGSYTYEGTRSEWCHDLLDFFPDWQCPSCPGEACEDEIETPAQDIAESETDCIPDVYVAQAATSCWANECHLRVKDQYDPEKWKDIEDSMENNEQNIEDNYNNILDVCTEPCGGVVETEGGGSGSQCTTQEVWPSECDCTG